LELKCPKCGILIGQNDLFCSQCGTRLGLINGEQPGDASFSIDVQTVLKTLIEFRAWIGQRKKTNVRFMKAYKQKIQDEIAPAISKFIKKYDISEEKQSKQFVLTLEVFACFERPMSFMDTKLRPSVGMGIWQERWMMAKAVDDYLIDCCREADRQLCELVKKTE